MANKLRLTVGGVELIINSDDDEQYMQSLAHEINRRISELTNKNSYLYYNPHPVQRQDFF